MAFWQGDSARTRRRLAYAGIPVIALALLAIVSVTAIAQRNGDFSCRASAVRVIGEGPFAGQVFEPIVANREGASCEDANSEVMDRTLGGPPAPGTATVRLANAETTRNPDDPDAPPEEGDNATARSELAELVLTGQGQTLRASAARSSAKVTCVGGQPKFESESEVVGLTVGTTEIDVPPGQPHTHVSLPPNQDTGGPQNVVVHVNHTDEQPVDGATVHTRRAVWVESPLGDMIVGESQVDYQGNPCQEPPQPTTIIIEKNSIPDSPQDFTFGGDLGDFALDDDNSDFPPATAPAEDKPRALAFEVEPGTYAVTEAAVEGWTLRDIDCDDEDSTADEATRTANVIVDEGEVVFCTFVNEQDAPPPGGIVTIRKDADPDNDQDFAFSGSFGDFQLDDDSEPTLPNQRDFGGLAAGTYTVTEAEVAEWRVVGITCDDPSGNTTTDPETRTATIQVDGSERIICEFSNSSTVPRCPEGTEPNENNECVIIERQCPEGSTQNEQGQCVVNETQPGQCPQGSIRNEQGQCIITETRCPEGSTRNAEGQCISAERPREPVPIDDIPGAEVSPCSRPGFGSQVGLVGTSGRDFITGTNRSDRIFAFGGSDRVSGGRGNDCIEGGTGNDQLDGSNGSDLLLGGSGRDILNGATGQDTMVGGSNHDKLSGGSGSDRMQGGSGRDRLSGGHGNDRLEGGADRDYIDGGNGADVVVGGSGNDAINVSTAGRGRDVVDCGPGRDVVRKNTTDRTRNCERVMVVRRQR
jgi:hypothetical protein